MRKLDATHLEAPSADAVAANIERLRALFPESITEGPDGVAVNVDVLKALVGDRTVTDADEKYGLSWHGKRRARQRALAPGTGTLRPCPAESVAWDATRNLVIEGDNLEVLKLLRRTHAGKVRLITIDPPYNTGKDFVYPDNFQDSVRNYLELTGQADAGRRIGSDAETGGRFHTDWLNMMYPRLMVARDLLHEEGVLFVTIDSTELDNLSLILKELMGPENFATTFVWEKRRSRENRKAFSVNHDYVVCVARNKEAFTAVRGMLPLSDEARNRYANPDDDPRGVWQSVAITAQAGHGTKAQFYTITTPSGRRVDPPSGNCWRFTEERLEALKADGRIWFGNDGGNVPRRKVFLSEQEQGLTPHTLWTADEVGTNDSAKRDLNALFDGQAVFDTPKPVDLVRRMVAIAGGRDGIVLDFFAGSGTTGEAVLRQNAADGGTRRFILVQLPEPLDPANKDQRIAAHFCDAIGRPRHIAELTKERVRRAGAAVRAANPAFEGDTGFRVFRLDSSNIRASNPDAADRERTLSDHPAPLADERSESDILHELLLERGLDLCVPASARVIAGKTVHAVGDGVLLACLVPAIDAAEVDELAHGIAAWRAELAPAGETTFVFRDSAFADEGAKTSLSAILGRNGIVHVRSL